MWLNKLVLLIIRFYQHIPLWKMCRFTPTCSQYGKEAFEKYHFTKAFFLTIKRILRCRPGGGSGYDPVP